MICFTSVPFFCSVPELLVEAITNSCQEEATQVSKAATEASKLPTWCDWFTEYMGAMNVVVL